MLVCQNSIAKVVRQFQMGQAEIVKSSEFNLLPQPVMIDQHYSPQFYAELWGTSASTVVRWFQDLEGVLKLSKLSKNGKRTRVERLAKFRTGGTTSMTAQGLIELVAEGVMGWAAAPNRFMQGRRRWIPRWRFQPCENLADAFELLEAAGPKTFSMGGDETGCFWAKVQIGGVMGGGRDRSMPRAITCAVARASGIDVDHVG
jgi:hypothetical protein